MGQAKARGSYSERKLEAETRNRMKAQAMKEERAAEEAAMTPEERIKRRKARMLLAIMLALTKT